MMRFAALFLALLASCLWSDAGAQPAPFPSRTVSLIVPYAPGGLPDTIARTVGQKLSERWGQSVVIENRPGGNGVVAAQYLMAKPPDGYTLMATDIATFSINPYMYKSLPYEDKDFTFVSLTARAPLFLALNPSIPAANFPQFVALAKANPGKYSYGSSGIGSIMQLVMESVKATLGIDVLHVPYKGTGQSVPAAVSNQVSLVVSAYPSLQGFAKDGKLRLIAVTTAQRSALASDVAPIADTEIPGFDLAPYIGITGPAGMPPAVVQKIASDVADVLKDPPTLERLRVLGIDPVGGGPREFAEALAADKAKVAKIVRQAGIKPE
ncbi:MAG TPA: tripartite tricarboxylate transporter substrate binding protein [Usitatibacter sp.]|jgi:tripartite-type tricarboxylate transporter receptor subunit TctC|nr:tripartite tricarboxylate transporter substrate binding protein [Usitatibacter sp.]